MKINYLYHGDCIEVLKNEIENNSIDLIYADPPYNLSGKVLNLEGNKTGGPFFKINEPWDTWDYDEYVSFTQGWIAQCQKKLKENGSIYISCTHHSIGEIIIAAKRNGLKLNNILVWHKTNAMPNITKRTFTHSIEFICWFVNGAKWKFNYSNLKIINTEKTKLGADKQMSDFIQMPILQGNERIHNSYGRAIHPSQKPEKLLEIILIASSNENDLVLDPFFGTGTTGIVAERLKRNWIGIEKDESFIKVANERIISKRLD